MVETEKNPAFLKWQEENPEIAVAFTALYEEAVSRLDEKTAQLVYLAALTAKGYGPGVRVHVQKALGAGAAVDEVKGAIFATIPAAGLPAALSVYDQVADLLEPKKK